MQVMRYLERVVVGHYTGNAHGETEEEHVAKELGGGPAKQPVIAVERESRTLDHHGQQPQTHRHRARGAEGVGELGREGGREGLC